MRYSLLDQLACPACLSPVACVTLAEVAFPVAGGRPSGGSRVSAGPGVGPVPSWRASSDLTRTVTELAGPAAVPGRGDEVVVDTGLLICSCGRWFPVERAIPELLPDHLRTDARDRPFFDAALPQLPRRLAERLEFRRPDTASTSDTGAHYKRAEISIKSKVADEAFFTPGYSSPFAFWDSDFSVYLLKLFGTVAPMLALRRGDRVVDSGCGYAWTTEWLFRSGFDTIGVDICRTYLEVGMARMGIQRPHLVIGDVEALPLAAETARAVLAYESFHHIPNRPVAVRSYERILQDGGLAILAEPGAAHEHAAIAIDVMEKYGILERGMELADVRSYCQGTSLYAEQIFCLKLAEGELGAAADRTFVGSHSVVEGNIFRLVKGGGPAVSDVQPEKRSLLSRIRRRVARRIETR